MILDDLLDVLYEGNDKATIDFTTDNLVGGLSLDYNSYKTGGTRRYSIHDLQQILEFVDGTVKVESLSATSYDNNIYKIRISPQDLYKLHKAYINYQINTLQNDSNYQIKVLQDMLKAIENDLSYTDTSSENVGEQ